MHIAPVRDLVFLSSSHSLPSYLQGIRGVRWHFTQNPEELKQYLMAQQGEILVVVRVENLTQRLVQAFLNWGKLNVKLSFIFIAQTIEKTAQQVAFANTQMLFLFESEAPRITDLVTRRLLGLAVKSRKQERITVQSQVMLKKSVFAEESPTGRGVQFIREGQMQDFSKGGAQISIGQGQVKIKDFLSLMYQNRHGQWVSVESQVRWVVSTATGDQIIGVQFLAVSA